MGDVRWLVNHVRVASYGPKVTTDGIKVTSVQCSATSGITPRVTLRVTCVRRMNRHEGIAPPS
jgi:hypothetical protein